LGHKKLREKKKTNINVEAIKDPENQRNFMEKMDKNIKDLNLNLQDIEANWNKVNTILMETAEQDIGLMKKKNNKWFNEVCRKEVQGRKLSRDSFLMLQDQDTKEIEIERRKCKHIIQREKMKFLNGILEEAERNCSHSTARNLYNNINSHNSK